MKKLIEVALPLDAINKASVHEKYIRVGHPSVIHKWWSRKPLVTARCMLFASLINDPSEYLDDQKEILIKRKELFSLVEQLVNWDNTGNEKLLSRIRMEIASSIAHDLNLEAPKDDKVLKFLNSFGPSVWDPFAGGGTIPLEAARLGLNSIGSDLNPVAVLINKTMLEIPGRFFDCPQISKKENQDLLPETTTGIYGIAEDVRYYGTWVIKQVQNKIRKYYPIIPVLKDGDKYDAEVVAWLWARTVECPNPGCKAMLPLTSKWIISRNKNGVTWVQPEIELDKTPPIISYDIRTGSNPSVKRTVTRNGAKCIVCDTPVDLKYIRDKGKMHRKNWQIQRFLIGNQHKKSWKVW